ncbi:UNVERIFIED_CONTAM: hypothetical protein K2H54_000151 [Gekko kuhli]
MATTTPRMARRCARASCARRSTSNTSAPTSIRAGCTPVTGKVRPHNGIDYVAPVGTPIMAAGSGSVVAAGYNQFNGNYVFIKHAGNYVTKYLHLSKRTVNKGQRVKQGQTIGNLGGTGRVTGPHLHYEFVWAGVHKNPRTLNLPQAETLSGRGAGQLQGAGHAPAGQAGQPGAAAGPEQAGQRRQLSHHARDPQGAVMSERYIGLMSAETAHELHALCTPGDNEIDRMGVADNLVAREFAAATHALLAKAGLTPKDIRAPRQATARTIRHRPQLGFTLQIGNAALLAALTGIDVVADFRTMDKALGGQGAPLVPAFHQAFFAHPGALRVVLNLGGIANISVLPGQADGRLWL